MTSKDTKISEFNQNLKYDQMPYITNVDPESLIKRADVKIILKNYLQQSQVNILLAVIQSLQ